MNLGPFDFWAAADIQGLDKGNRGFVKPDRDGERMFERHNRVMEEKKKQKEQKKKSPEKEPDLVIHEEEVYNTMADIPIPHPIGRVEEDTPVRRPKRTRPSERNRAHQPTNYNTGTTGHMSSRRSYKHPVPYIDENGMIMDSPP